MDLNIQLKAMLHRQDETDEKKESMAMDMHKTNGEITFIKEQTKANTERINETYNVVKNYIKMKNSRSRRLTSPPPFY